MSVRMVGCMKAPAWSIRLPPVTTRAPPATARCTWSSSLSSASFDDRGASVVCLSIGSPGLKFSRADWNFSRKRSASASTTMKRFDAVQACPALPMRPLTADLTALSRSASSSTMKASLPPSSIVVFFRFCPALAATTAPAASLPVRATPRMRGSSMTCATCSLEMNRLV